MWPLPLLSSIKPGLAAGASAAITAIVVGLMAFGLHSCSVARLETKHKAAMTAQVQICTDEKAEMAAECQKDKQITTEASNAYQTNLADVNRQLANLKRVRSQSAAAQCVPIAQPAGRLDGAASGAKYAQPHGVDANTLYDYAAECEQYRQQVKGLQGFARETWKAKGQ